MKQFNRASLPDQIKYNKKVYVRGEKTYKSIQVNVLSTNLKHRVDLHGKAYKPSVFYYNPLDLEKSKDITIPCNWIGKDYLPQE